MNNLSKRQKDFIKYMSSQADSHPEYQARILACIRKAESGNAAHVKDRPKKSLAEVRRDHHPDRTADFLALFKSPSALKFLTHDFDPRTDNQSEEPSLDDVRARAMELLTEAKGLPQSLFALFKNFLTGPEWIDYTGRKQRIFLSCDRLEEWTTNNPGLHPIASTEFYDSIQRFRSTVRIQKTYLPKLLALAVNQAGSCRGLHIEQKDLDKADFYTNVYSLNKKILQRVLRDIALYNSEADVEISYSRYTWNKIYRPGVLKITHFGSVASPFEEVRSKLESSGGILGTLLNDCQGYCDWTIEANFEGECKRWHILDIQGKPEIEDLPNDQVQGFTHIFTFYRNMQ